MNEKLHVHVVKFDAYVTWYQKLYTVHTSYFRCHGDGTCGFWMWKSHTVKSQILHTQEYALIDFLFLICLSQLVAGNRLFLSMTIKVKETCFDSSEKNKVARTKFNCLVKRQFKQQSSWYFFSQRLIPPHTAIHIHPMPVPQPNGWAHLHTLFSGEPTNLKVLSGLYYGQK